MKKTILWAGLLVGACQALGLAMEKLEMGKAALLAALPFCAVTGAIWAAGTALFFAGARMAGRRLLPDRLAYDPERALPGGWFAGTNLRSPKRRGRGIRQAKRQRTNAAGWIVQTLNKFMLK